MKIETFTTEQLQKLLESQNALNIEYTGEEWADKVPDSKFVAAVVTEVAEFLESAPENWKWWKPHLENEAQNLVIETIDVLHFSLSLFLKAYPMSKILYDHEQFKDQMIEEIEVQDDIALLMHAVGGYMYLNGGYGIVERNTLSLFSFFYIFMNIMTQISDRTLDEIYEGYFKKNELNLHRIRNGYMTGDYQKHDEDGAEDNAKLDV